MKRQNSDWDREKKIHKIVKGTDKTSKYKKNIYNMLTDEDDESDFDSDDSELLRSYNYYVKRR
jgi:hypothetical protein